MWWTVGNRCGQPVWATGVGNRCGNRCGNTDADFDAEVMQSAVPVVMDFYATWCGPCRQLAPTMDSLADQYAGKFKFVKVNVDESPKLAQKFQVEGIPMLVFLQNGKTAETSVGLVAKEDLILRLDSLLQTNTQPGATGR